MLGYIQVHCDTINHTSETNGASFKNTTNPRGNRKVPTDNKIWPKRCEYSSDGGTPRILVYWTVRSKRIGDRKSLLLARIHRGARTVRVHRNYRQYAGIVLRKSPWLTWTRFIFVCPALAYVYQVYMYVCTWACVVRGGNEKVNNCLSEACDDVWLGSGGGDLGQSHVDGNAIVVQRWRLEYDSCRTDDYG